VRIETYNGIAVTLYNGHCYGVMDGSRKDAGSASNHGCQTNWMTLPSGFELVPLSLDIVNNVLDAPPVTSYQYRTTGVHFSNGYAYCSSQTGSYDCAGGMPNQLHVSGQSYKAAHCQRKVFMRTAASACTQLFPTNANSASSTGDPHVTNVLGERFDLLKRGTHVFVQVPRGADAEHTLLRVEANVTGGKLCDYAFVSELKMTGKWVAELTPSVQQHDLHFVALPWGTVRVKSWRHSVGPTHMKVSYGHMASGLTYLNFHVGHLAELNLPVGGLLGVDDHTGASSKENCIEDPTYANLTDVDQMEAGRATVTAF